MALAFADLTATSSKLCAARVVLLSKTIPNPLLLTSPCAAALPTLVPYNIKPEETNLSYSSNALATSGYPIFSIDATSVSHAFIRRDMSSAYDVSANVLSLRGTSRSSICSRNPFIW